MSMIWRGIRAVRNEERGQALIELSISLPLLMMLLLGAVEFGRLTYAAIEVSNAARAAAQYGAMNGGAYSSSTTSYNYLDEPGMLTAAQGDAGDITVSFASGYPDMSCTCSSGTNTAVKGAPPTGCSPPATKIVTTILVKTQTSFNPLISIPGWTHGSITLYGWAQEEVLPTAN